MILDFIKERAAKNRKRILLADASDPRILNAAQIAIDEHLGEIELVGPIDEVKAAIDEFAPSLENIKIWSVESFIETELLVNEYYTRRSDKIHDLETARNEVLNDPLLFGALVVRAGYADGLVAGSLSTTATVIRAGIRGIGLAQGVRSLSSLFLMDFPSLGEFRKEAMTFAFADCAVIPKPDAHQLADIAITTAETYRKLTEHEPRVAMLSFSTRSSASSEETKVVALATEIARERNPNLIIDGELQFDAAFVTEVADRKAPGSPVKGNANVFIFPNLDAGNIGYKIAERLGMGQAIGPILQGLDKPMNDLSRGASIDDIVTMIAVTGVM